MYQELNEQLVHVKSELHRKKKLNLQLNDFREELSNIEFTTGQLKRQLREEKADVKKLEGFTIANFFSTISGTKYEKLDKENREVLAVQLQLEEAEKTRNEINDSMMDVLKKLGEVKNSERTYKELLEKKEQFIMESNSNYANELYRLSEQEGDIQAYIKEINEAISAGEGAKNALINAESSLNSASTWGTVDMFGGGMISSAIKHSKMDDASGHIHIAQSRMRTFQKELLDINEMVHVDMDVSGLLKFADFFFDGLIVDWMVQGRITNSKDQVRDNLSKVRSIIRKLQDELSNLQGKLERVQQERKALIESI
ncbi:coiled-coil domain-containing protein [Ornithinibacillus californiensis]|uniref:hypothetical protein n=1 Tax=Ornithinibacillus californiensis TaxID=161536 RepID=UPI00064DA7A7|nr:hypothetical protein [Ornithinibacillus californiensis]